MNRFKKITAVTLTGFLLSGCAGTMQRPTPPKAGTPVYAVKHHPSGANMPIGTVVVDKSSLAARKTLTDGEAGTVMGSAILFGVIGALVATAAMESNTKKANFNINHLKQFDLATTTFALLHQKKKSWLPLMPVRHAAQGERYELRPYLYLEANDRKDSELMVVLSVARLNSAGKPTWRGQYVRHIILASPSLLSNRSYLSANIQKALRETLKVFQNDLAGKYNATNTKKRYTLIKKGSMLFGKKGFLGYLLPSSDRSIILFQTGMGAGGNPYGGVHIFSASGTVVAPYVRQ